MSPLVWRDSQEPNSNANTRNLIQSSEIPIHWSRIDTDQINRDISSQPQAGELFNVERINELKAQGYFDRSGNIIRFQKDGIWYYMHIDSTRVRTNYQGNTIEITIGNCYLKDSQPDSSLRRVNVFGSLKISTVLNTVLVALPNIQELGDRDLTRPLHIPTTNVLPRRRSSNPNRRTHR